MKRYQIIYADLLEKLWYCLGDYLCRHKKHHWNYRYCSRCGIDIFIFQAIERRILGFSKKWYDGEWRAGDGEDWLSIPDSLET